MNSSLSETAEPVANSLGLAPPRSFRLRTLWAAVFLTGCSSSSASVTLGPETDELIVPVSLGLREPTRIEAGEMDDSRWLQRRLRLENRGDETIAIDRIDADCHCVTFENALVALKPGDSIEANLVIDLRDDRSFKGLLGVPARGFDAQDREIFSVVVCTRAPP
ncbi:MAG: DUF1573 domain-containing protein [Planctomycetes bacterium]|nr:DUF1573 domain-containing protein [Planctomycetota bacterium]